MLPPVHISYSLKNQIVKCYNNYEQKCIASTKTFRILSYFKLFRFATYKECFLILLGIIFTSIAAIGLPYNVILYGEFTTLLIDRSNEFSTSKPTLMLQLFCGGRLLINATMKENQLALLDDSKAFGISCTIVTLLQFICLTFGINLINYSAVKQISRIRKLFFYSMLRQDMSWYDTVPDYNISSRITDDLDKIKQGIGDKLAVFIYLIMSFIICVLVSFFYGWLLTLVILSCTPIIIISTTLVARVQSSLTANEMQSYSFAGNVAKEVFSSIRTVIAFGGEQKECERYKKCLKIVELNGKIKCLYFGLANGLMWLIIYCCYALAFWYGFQLIINSYNNDNDGDREYTPAVLVIIVLGVLTGAQNFGLTAPHLETFTTAIDAANIIFNIIDKRSKIDSLSGHGEFPIIITGNLKFRNVSFRYPVRDDITILNNLNLSIKAGQTVALVGSAGCGKSTILQLIQRLYDPLQGSIEIDGININKFNTSWHRSMIGVVGPDPLLFSVSISDNISYGNPLVSQRDIEIAARISNCHYFIMKLPNRYSTIIGGHIQLSVGRKQRIAIARAIVGDPKILLFDEATSALDYNCEKIVQNALDKASHGRTIITIPHRLSTIINVDKIVFIENGCVAEQGSYKKLMEKKGLFYNLMKVKEHKCAKQLKDKTIKQGKKQHNSSSSSVSSIIQYSDIESDECDGDDALNNNSNINNNVDKTKTDDVIKEDGKYKVSLITLMRLNSPEWIYILIGFLASTINGLTLPICAILLGEIYGLLSLTDLNTLQHTSALYCMLFILIGFIAGVTAFLQIYFINFTGVQLTSRLRQLFFKAIIKQEIGWFDDVTKNSTGTICKRLAGDCAKVQGATGSPIASIVQSISSLSIGIAISFYYSWQLTLVSIVAISIIFVACLFESRYVETSNLDEKMAMENACKIANDAIVNIRTIASLGREICVYDSYVEEMNKFELACSKKIRLRGCIFALGQTTPFFAYALALYYGGTLVANDGLEYKNVIKVSEALIIGAWALAEALSFAPDVNAALLSAGRLIKILNIIPKYYNQTMMSVPDSLDTIGNIRYCNVNFSYPNRLNVSVIKNLTLDIQNGSTIALVGKSGCGKSTFIQLLLRLYDPASGHIELNGTSTIVFPIEYLRLQMGIVSQKSILFNRKISENIAYGNNTRNQIPLTEIIEAAKMANIHEFISTLPLGYDTLISPNGLQLSDGQNQRIAIARVLIRNPKILLLDDVTSALDKQNEQIVQEILNKIRIGRTCIIAAHRLNTIKNVDMICVLQNGEIIEKGTHKELIKMNGIYSKLYEMES